MPSSAERAPRLRAEGVRSPHGAGEEREIRRWLASLYEVQYLGGGWPVEWGGSQGHGPAQDLVVMEELIRAGAYRPLDQVMLAAHAIIAWGTEAQKSELLPKIRSGEHVWCQLFSEPDAGSDLASLRTRAEPDGDAFVVTGQKIWSTDAHWAEMGLLLARTDPKADRHAGITAFLAATGWRLNLEYTFIDQNELRSGTGTASPAAVVNNPSNPALGGGEIEKETINRYYTLGASYRPNEDWSVNLLVPYVSRSHSDLRRAAGTLHAFADRARPNQRRARLQSRRRQIDRKLSRVAAHA